jgi:5-methylcytosine-specific restriction enzyme subunit McrC
VRIELTEWGTAAGVVLNDQHIAALARSDAFNLRPDPDEPGRWCVSSKQHVGAFHAGDLEIRVTPKVPVHRLLELLCTSLERIQWEDRDTEWSASDDFLTIVARSFVTHAERVLRRGLVQGYVTVDESLLGVRGRVAMGRQLRRQTGLTIPVEVTYDDYTTDVTENQLLAGAGRLLLRLPRLPADVAARLRRLEYLLLDITPTPPSPTPPKVTWTRLNQRYRLAVALARLILRSCSIETAGAQSVIATAFLVDMNQVFEDVVAVGIRGTLQPLGLAVDLQRPDHLDDRRLVQIRTDVLVRDGARPVAVADAKYKRPASDGLSNSDIYQAVSYATRYGLDTCTLIYAEEAPVTALTVGPVMIRLTWLDLSQSAADRSEAIAKLAGAMTRPRLPEVAGIGRGLHLDVTV